jgi:hypothetical protein
MVPPEPILANQVYHTSTELCNKKSTSAVSLATKHSTPPTVFDLTTNFKQLCQFNSQPSVQQLHDDEYKEIWQ